MKHARADYQNIQEITANGAAPKIPDDEPVFLLRAQDKHAAWAVRYWAGRVVASGGDREIARIAMEQARKMEAWPKKKSPDLVKTEEEGA